MQIAEIEANRDVAIAEIHADTEAAAIEAAAEEQEDDDQWLEDQISGLSAACVALQDQHQAMLAMLAEIREAQARQSEMLTALLILIPSPPPQEAQAVPPAETPAENNPPSGEAGGPPASPGSRRKSWY